MTFQKDVGHNASSVFITLLKLILIKDMNFWFFLGEDRDLKEFGKFKPFRSVPHYDTMKPEYVVDGSTGEAGIFEVTNNHDLYLNVTCSSC